MDPRLSRKPGTRPLDLAQWIERDAKAAHEIAYRLRLLQTRRDIVLAQTPQCAEAEAELYAMLSTHLGHQGPSDPSPLAQLCGLAQEDFCILEKPADGEEYVLTAGLLCFPSRWSLAEKIGRRLTAIHAPVPDYSEDVARRVGRLFEAIREGHPLWRANWTLHSTPELHQPSGAFRQKEGTEDGFYIRVERQTFVRLPQTQAVVFGIRTYVDPIEALIPDKAAGLVHALHALTPEEQEYRGGAKFHLAALHALEQIAGATPPE